MSKEIFYVSSRANPTVVWASSLKEKKHRDASAAFLAEGIKLFREAAEGRLPITHVFVAESKKDLYIHEIIEALTATKMEKASIYVLQDSCFDKISTEKAPQGVITAIKHLDFFKRCIKINMKEFFSSSRVLCLCSVRDPSNLGAIVRSAVAFGTDSLLLSADCADLYNPKTLRAAMGSLFKIRAFIVEDLADAVIALRQSGRRVFAAELTENAVSLAEACPCTKDIFIIGNEGHGIPREISSSCDGSVYIPIKQGVESLNASVAASVLLWEQAKK